MKLLLTYSSLVAMLLLAQCRTSRSVSGNPPAGARISQEGFITCFEPGVAIKGQPVCCEASALLYDGSKLFFANDKDMPDGRSSVFYWPYSNGFIDTAKKAVYLDNPVYRQGKKYEDFALSPDGKLVFLTTGFDRVQPGSTEWNAYNTMLYWQAGNENRPQVISANGTDSTTVYLREKISKALANATFPDGTPYFKIEGLAATENMLYFGIREEGKKYDDFKYKVKILRTGYHVFNGRITLDDSVSVVSDINVAALVPSITQPLGLSSIEYDRFNKRFLILTSYENGTNLGAYLWSATLDDLQKNTMTIINDPQGKPLHFTHKAEDIIVINRRKAILINDDDRTMTTVNGQVRMPNQAAYTIISFEKQ